MIPGSMEDRIMKKYAIIFAAICACLVLSCTKENPKFEEETAAPGMKTVTISASIDDVLTKTSYDNGTTFSWTEGDQISVMCSDGQFRTFTAEKNAAASTFTGEVPENVTLGNYAFFPADDNHNGSNRFFYLPESKDLSGTVSADLPMLGSKDTGSDAYLFQHCTGAVLFTLTNIPENITTVEISFESASLKLSGAFYIDGPSVQTALGAGCYWTARSGNTTSDKTFTRKVKVNSDHTAQVYLPYAATASMYAANTVNVKGFDNNGNTSVLLENKSMKAISGYTFALAHVKPLAPLVLSNLSNIDWTASDVATSTLNASDSRKCLTELKATADSYYMYVRVKGPVAEFSGDYLDVYLSDGNGEHYPLNDNNKYWSTGGETVYIKEHKGSITSNSLSMTFNDKSVEAKTTNDGTDIYWYIAFPRSAHSLISTSGTVYIGFVLWNAWAVTGVIPTKYSAMLPVTLP